MKKKKSKYSISKKLRDQNKSNDYFEIMLNNIPLEDLLALKLELGYKAIGFPLHGFPIWKSSHYIVRDALLKYALCATKNKVEAAALLGLPSGKFFRLLRKYDLREYLEQKEKEDESNI